MKKEGHFVVADLNNLPLARMDFSNTELGFVHSRVDLLDAVKKLSRDLEVPEKISEIEIKKDELELLAEYALYDACTPGNSKITTK